MEKLEEKTNTTRPCACSRCLSTVPKKIARLAPGRPSNQVASVNPHLFLWFWLQTSVEYLQGDNKSSGYRWLGCTTSPLSIMACWSGFIWIAHAPTLFERRPCSNLITISLLVYKACVYLLIIGLTNEIRVICHGFFFCEIWVIYRKIYYTFCGIYHEFR